MVTVFLLGLFWQRGNLAGALATLALGSPTGVLAWIATEIRGCLAIQLSPRGRGAVRSQRAAIGCRQPGHGTARGQEGPALHLGGERRARDRSTRGNPEAGAARTFACRSPWLCSPRSWCSGGRKGGQRMTIAWKDQPARTGKPLFK
ncbi:hypothetical protein [Thiococcus pfennigii]|uniref:hypothetical protein n=1 Tax=Thiococcus pfennigii TaxID=1057 RepID=UPI003B82DDF0